MDWWVVLIMIGGLLMVFFLSGLPVAFAFLALNILGSVIWLGGPGNLGMVFANIIPNISNFSMVPIPLFILMGELLFRSGLVKLLVDAIGKWVGRVPGSLSLVAIASGAAFGLMSGSAISGCAVFGSTLIPEMRSRGYSKTMSIGPVMAAGSLAMIIPPSIMAVLLATLARIDVGKVLIAGLLPGFLLAGLQATYVLVRSRMQPHLAPAFAPGNVTWPDRLKSTAGVLPLGLVIFLVLGLILLGVATPSEAAATGCLGAFILALAYHRLNWQVLKSALSEAIMLSVMIFMIIMGSMTFSSILAYTGTTQALVRLASDLTISPFLIVVVMQLILILLGMFIEGISMMMITVPIYFPVILALGLDPIWFAILMLINIDLGTITPPFGVLLFTMKGVMPDASMREIVTAGLPFVFISILGMLIIHLAPSIATFLPSRM